MPAKKPHVFVLVVSNGQEYEDYYEDVGGVFASLKPAVKHAKDFADPERIEEWRGTELKRVYQPDGSKK